MTSQLPRSGVTLVDVIIASTVLAMFLGGLFTLYSGGNRLGSTTLWAQHASNNLKLACRTISESIKKSSYPSSITFPGQIDENKKDEFCLHYFKGTLEAASVTGGSSNYSGSKVLSLTEAVPGKIGFASADNRGAELIYHVLSLNEKGELHYGRWQEMVAGDLVKGLSRSSLPAGNHIFYSIIARDVESVSCSPTNDGDSFSPLMVSIVCRMPKGNTMRTEQAVGTPNVALIEHTSTGGW